MNWFYGKQLGNPLPGNMDASENSRMNMKVMSRETMSTSNDDSHASQHLEENVGNFIAQQDPMAYGTVYLSRDSTISVSLPASVAYVTFNDVGQFFCGVKQEKGGIIVEDAGNYKIDFSLRVTATSAAFATFMLQADKSSLPGGSFGRMLTKEPQSVSESIIATLGSGAHVRIAVTSATVLGLLMSNASLSVKRLE